MVRISKSQCCKKAPRSHTQNSHCFDFGAREKGQRGDAFQNRWNNFFHPIKQLERPRRNFNHRISCEMVAVIAYGIRSLDLMACVMWKNASVNTESQFGRQSSLTGKFRSFENSCVRRHKMSLVNFVKFGGSRRLRVCLYVPMITGMDLAGWAEGLEKHKKLKCKMVCYLVPGRSMETRCYLYVVNGLSHLGRTDYRFIVLLFLS